MVYDKDNPMKYISFDKYDNTYLFKKMNVRKKSKNLNIIVLFCKQHVENEMDINFYEYDKLVLNEIKTDDYKLYMYIWNNEFYCELNELITTLKYCYKTHRLKINEHKKDIQFCSWKPNEFGGYEMMEFISMPTAMKIILNSDSKISSKIKNNIVKNMEQSQEKHNMNFHDHKKIKYDENNIPVINKKDMKNDIIDNKLAYMFKNFDDKYGNSIDKSIMEIYKKHIDDNKLKYNNNHMLYLCILGMMDPEYKNRYFIKIGYTYDIEQRIVSLSKEYKCKVYPLIYKLANSEKEEKKLHNILEKKFSNLKFQFILDKTKKTEIYVYDEKICEEFVKYCDNIVLKIKNLVNEDIQILKIKNDHEIKKMELELRILEEKRKILELEMKNK